MTNVGNGYAGLIPTATITGGATTPAELEIPTVSTQPKWRQNDIVLITKRALTNLGTSLKDADLSNVGRVAQKTGD